MNETETHSAAPIGVLLCGVRGRVLVVEHDPQKVFGAEKQRPPYDRARHGETTAEAAIRALYDETTQRDLVTGEVLFPGFQAAPHELTVFEDMNVPEANERLVFYVLQDESAQQRAWEWYGPVVARRSDILKKNQWRKTPWNENVLDFSFQSFESLIGMVQLYKQSAIQNKMLDMCATYLTMNEVVFTSLRSLYPLQ